MERGFVNFFQNSAGGEKEEEEAIASYLIFSQEPRDLSISALSKLIDNPSRHLQRVAHLVQVTWDRAERLPFPSELLERDRHRGTARWISLDQRT